MVGIVLGAFRSGLIEFTVFRDFKSDSLDFGQYFLIRSLDGDFVSYIGSRMSIFS